MKKLYLTLMLLLAGFVSFAQTVEASYHFVRPAMHEIEGYEQIHFEGCMQSALAGQPSLPWQHVSLMLPQGQEAVSIEVILSDFAEIEGNHQLYPYQPARAYSMPERNGFVKDEALYQSRQSYPETNYSRLTTHYLNGIGFAFSAFTPVQYVPVSGKVMFARTVKVIVKTTASRTDNSRMLWVTPNNANRAKSLAQNPEMLDSYSCRNRTESVYDLLVITTEQYVASFDAYKQFYEERGLITKVVSLENIISRSEGRDNQEKIRNYIKNEYQSNGIIMVLLGGDVNLVPYRGFYCSVQSSTVHVDDNIPADLYYCALDGTWNDNDDNKWGEIGEDDLLPEVGIGRMCFENAAELQNMMHKTFTYQTTPVLGEFRKVTMGGEHLYDDPVSNGSQYLELLIGERSDNGYTTIGIPEDYQFTRLYEEEGSWSGEALKETINQGTQYVHHDGHANTDYVAGWFISSINDNNFSGANGIDHNYTFFHTSGCICGDFSSDCILERMTKISNFAVVTLGNSRYGWFNEGQTEGPAIHLHRETEDAYYHERIPYTGLALGEAKIQTAPWVNAPGQWEEGALRWNFYDLNLMGDVAVSPWHDEPFDPQITYQSELLVGSAGTQVTVADANGNRLKNFRCSLFMGNDRIGFATTDANGVADITFESAIATVGDFKLIVTGCDAHPKTLMGIVMPANCAFVVYEAFEINDGPNGNQQADFGETLSLNVRLKNAGTVNASNVTATLSTDSPYVTITDAFENIASLPASQNIMLENAFTLTVSDVVPNNTMIPFTITCTDGSDTWVSRFNMKAFAPELVFESISMDITQGNGDAIFDPGETAVVHFTIKNVGGSAAPATMFDVYCSAPEIAYTQNHFSCGNIAVGQTYTADFEFTVNASSPIGIAYQLLMAMYCGRYSFAGDYIFSVGTLTEDFETGDFSKFDWTFEQTAWIIDDQAHTGAHCARSGQIGNDQSSSLVITIDIASDGEISFWRKVSSEGMYDKLCFYVDGIETGNWSGVQDWGKVECPIKAGRHTLEWKYAKDFMMASGEDCAWIDDVTFPPASIVWKVESKVADNNAVYPNPNNGRFRLNLSDARSTVTVFNDMGQVVISQEVEGQTAEFNIEGLASGLYFVKVTSATTNETHKFVKK